MTDKNTPNKMNMRLNSVVTGKLENKNMRAIKVVRIILLEFI